LTRLSPIQRYVNTMLRRSPRAVRRLAGFIEPCRHSPRRCRAIETLANELGRSRAHARWFGELPRYFIGRNHQGSDRPRLEGRCRVQGMGVVHGQVLSGRRQDQLVPGLWLLGRADAGSCVEAVWRRPDSRERHEAGGQYQEFRAGDASWIAEFAAQSVHPRELRGLFPQQHRPDPRHPGNLVDIG